MKSNAGIVVHEWICLDHVKAIPYLDIAGANVNARTLDRSGQWERHTNGKHRQVKLTT